MGKIQVNFDEVPDKILPLEAGVYVMRVENATVEPTKDGKGEKLLVVMKVDDEASPNHGRQLYDHISFKMETSLKRLWKSAGLNPGRDGINTEDIIGKHVKVRVAMRSYKDDSGNQQETSAVKEYMFGD